MNTVLNIIDKDGDGKISLKELEAVGLIISAKSRKT